MVCTLTKMGILKLCAIIKDKEMKLIGKGTFTKAYLKDKHTVILHSVDPIKECMSLGMFPNSRLFPKIERLTYEEVSTYKMKLLKKVRAPKRQLKPAHYTLYKELKKLAGSISFKLRDNVSKLNVPTSVKAHLVVAVEACMNYTDQVAFEISPRNIAESNGNLILMDCFYDANLLRKQKQRFLEGK